MAENFDLIFGQSAGSQYAWSDADYQNGWQTVGNTPPTAQQFDALQRRSDTKAKELNDALTPLVSANTTDNRQPLTAYDEGDIKYSSLLPTGWFLACTVSGTTSASAIVIPSPLEEGDEITDGTVTWTIRKINDIDTSTFLTAELTPVFNKRDVITTSGTYTVPVTGWYKVTCIGGGGAGGNGGGQYNQNTGGKSGTRGGTTSFGTYCSASGGHSGAGGGGSAGGGGGAAGEVANAYVHLTANDTVTATVGAGGVAPTSGNTGTNTGQDGSGGAKGGSGNFKPGQGAISAYGSGNSGCPYIAPTNNYTSQAPISVGGSNGTIYGGGGGGSMSNHIPATTLPVYGASGGANGKASATIVTLNTTYPKGGDGGDGAIIVEYFDTSLNP